MIVFDGTEGEKILVDEATEYTANYRSANPGAIKGHFYGKEKILQLFDNADAVGIRIYYGIDNEGKKLLILVGANEDGNDFTDIMLDYSVPCPTICGEDNFLNSDPT